MRWIVKKTSNGVTKALPAVLALALAATAGMPARAADRGATRAPAKPRPSTVDPSALARGARLWAHTCAGCHNLRDPQELTDAEWDVALGQMWVRAGLTAQQVRDIAAFLKASNQ